MVAGFNAAAIIWLYGHFVPRVEHDKVERRLEAAQEQLVAVRERVAVLQGIYAARVE